MTTAEGIVHVLLVEDDVKLAHLTARYLLGHGIVATCVLNGKEGLAEAMRTNYDVVLLDIMLPGRNGIEVCQELRRSRDVPIIIVTARGDEADRVYGLEIGADDYLAKPFSSRELVARINALVRRSRGRLVSTRRVMNVGALTIDTSARTVRLGSRALDLTTYEFELLRALAENAGRVLTRERLLDLAKGNAEEAYDRSIDVHISRLRQKLSDDPRRPTMVKTVRGIGYLLAVEEEAR